MSETTEPALLPCPFCDSGAKYTSSYSAIMCFGGRCHAFLSRSVNETSHDLALRWNTRVPDPELARLRAELAAAKRDAAQAWAFVEDLGKALDFAIYRNERSRDLMDPEKVHAAMWCAYYRWQSLPTKADAESEGGK